MDTVYAMFKRILILLGTAILGFAACLASIRMAGSWSILPNRDLDKSAGYFKDVLQKVNENYVDGKAADYAALTRLSLHGMVDSLDPHSQYLEAKDFAELEEDLSGEYGGIGIEVELHKGAFSVVNPIAGSPGDKAGILLGDEIVSIDGKPVEHDVPMDKIVDKLRGKPNTHVRVGLVRPSTGKRMDLDLVREVIRIESIRGARVIDNATGYINIQEFNDHTGEQFDDALNGLLKRGIDSLVIDLRNNPGGPLDAAVEVAEPFFKKDDLIVYYQGRKASDRENYLSETEGEPLKLPVAILVNGLTASAAEIVAGAKKDAGHAVVVGERSYGKGSVQTIFTLKNGEGLRLTTAHYFTPSGALISGHGIMPQVEVVMTPDEDVKIEEQNSRPDITDPEEFKERFDFTPIDDRQLDVALDVLRAARSYNR
jgi:carboxyl-terminal processing protease